MSKELQNNILNTKACVVCGSSSSRVFYQQEDACLIVRCSNCSMVYTVSSNLRNKPSKTIYTENYYKSNDPVLGYEDYLSGKADIQQTFLERIKTINKLITPGKLLDVGCAHGFFLEVAKYNGWNVEGLDVSEAATRYAREILNLEVRQGLVEEDTFYKNSSFDCVTLWDLVEQVPDPSAVISKISTLLRKDGILALTIRDIDSAMSKISGKKWIHFRPKEKFVYFNKKTIAALLSKYGFQVIKYSYKGAGKRCTLEVLLKKIENYNRPIARFISAVLRLFKLEKAHCYLNFLDTRIVIAKKLQ